MPEASDPLEDDVDERAGVQHEDTWDVVQELAGVELHEEGDVEAGPCGSPVPVTEGTATYLS